MSESEVPQSQLYDRQESLGVNRNQRVMVVGCGGIGAWVAYFLGLAGVAHLELYDSDKIEEHNLNRLPFTPADIGESKSLALARLITKARPDVKVDAYGNFDPEWHRDNVDRAHCMVVSTDSLKSRRVCYEAAQSVSLPYIECGAEGNTCTLTGAPAEWQTELEEHAGYQSVPVFVGPCTLVASMAVYHVLYCMLVKDTINVNFNGALKINVAQGV